MRYWWELVPPRRLFARPPVLNSCWIIASRALKSAGGFKAAARSITPEAHFARSLLASDGYSFMRSGKSPGVWSAKSAGEQRMSAIRTRYPQVHRRPEQALLTSAAEVFLVLPFVLVIGGFWLPIGNTEHVLTLTTCVLLIASYQLMARSTRINSFWFGLFALPVVAVWDMAILHYSMIKYEFGEVKWKERNICIPAMHVVPRLPKT